MINIQSMYEEDEQKLFFPQYSVLESILWKKSNLGSKLGFSYQENNWLNVQEDKI